MWSITLGWDHTIVGWDLIQYHWCLYKKNENFDIMKKKETLSPQGQCHMKMKLRDQHDAPTIKEHQKWPANHQKLGERHGTESVSRLLEGTNTVLTLWSQISSFQNYETMISVVLNHPVVVLYSSSLSQWMHKPRSSLLCDIHPCGPAFFSITCVPPTAELYTCLSFSLEYFPSLFYVVNSY